MTVVDIGSLISDEGALCAQPLLDAFQAVNDFCDQIETLLGTANPDGAVLANGSTPILACLQYASALTCAGDNNIPSWAQVKALFSCTEACVETVGAGIIPNFTGPGKLVSIVQTVPDPPLTPVTPATLVYNSTLNHLQVLEPDGTLVGPGVEICYSALWFLG